MYSAAWCHETRAQLPRSFKTASYLARGPTHARDTIMEINEVADGDPKKIIQNLLHPDIDGDNNRNGNTYDYGSMGMPEDNEFLPLSGGDEFTVWASEQYAAEGTAEVDPNRPSATTLIYLCALCSSLTSVLLGYGTSNSCLFVYMTKRLRSSPFLHTLDCTVRYPAMPVVWREYQS